jgi:hypothetical protein
MRNPFITDEMRVMSNDPDIDSRCTGRSLGIALKIIGTALCSPGESFYINDHHGSHNADKSLAWMIQGIIEKLDLKYLKITQSDKLFKIKYTLFEERK